MSALDVRAGGRPEQANMLWCVEAARANRCETRPEMDFREALNIIVEGAALTLQN